MVKKKARAQQSKQQSPGPGATLYLAQEQIEDKYLDLDSITGVGIGSKIVAGRLGDTPCITVFVTTKRPLGELQPQERIPEYVKVKDPETGHTVSIPTDVVQTGEIIAESAVAIPGPPETLDLAIPTALTVNPGDPSAHFNLGGYGTLGCMLTDGTNQFALSNNHVYARSNDATVGDAIVFGSGTDSTNNQFASLSAFRELSSSGINDIDAAYGQITGRLPTHPGITQIGIPLGAGVATRNLRIQKYGARTGHTTGDVIAVNSSIKVDYGGFTAQFRNLIATRGTNGAFTKPGDSGSVYVSNDRIIVGHHFAGARDNSISYGSQFCHVLDWARLELVIDARPADTSLLYRYYIHTPFVDHFYTVNPCGERSGFEHNYAYEGLACRLYSRQISGSIPLYRKYHDGAYDHFYTTSRNEAPHYTHEGPVGFILRNQAPGTLPLYRMFNPYEPNGVVRHDHWLTTSAAERDNAVNNLGHRFEGVLGYVLSP